MPDLDPVTRHAWDQYGLDPYRPGTPPWVHVVGRRLHLAGYNWENSEHHVLEGDWAIDIDRLPASTGKAARGDVLLYVGRAEGTRDLQVWPPALVLQAGRSTDGEQRVITLTNDRLIPLPRRRLSSPLRARLHRPPAVLSPTIRHKVLGLWGLDVLCLQCGAPGTRVQYGFPALERGHASGDGGTLPPSPPQGHIGCLPPEDGHEWECGGCGWRWPDGDPIVESLWDVLERHDCDHAGEFEVLAQQVAEDDRLTVLFGDENPHGDEIGVALRGQQRSLRYPFYMSEFWEIVESVRGDTDGEEDRMLPTYPP